MVGPCLESQWRQSATMLPQGAVHPIRRFCALSHVNLLGRTRHDTEFPALLSATQFHSLGMLTTSLRSASPSAPDSRESQRILFIPKKARGNRDHPGGALDDRRKFFPIWVRSRAVP